MGLSVDPMVMKRQSTSSPTRCADGGARYGYQDGRGTDATTAIGLLCRLYLTGTRKTRIFFGVPTTFGERTRL